MSELLKIAGVTSGKLASGIKVDEFGRIELSRTVEPKRIVGNVLEPYSEEYRGPVSVFGLELHAINGAYRTDGFPNSSMPTPDGWLLATARKNVRYDSKGSILWVQDRDDGVSSLMALAGGHLYGSRRLGEIGNYTYRIDKFSYETGEIVASGELFTGLIDLIYVSEIDTVMGVFNQDSKLTLMYIDPNTLEYTFDNTLHDKLVDLFGEELSGSVTCIYEQGELYISTNQKGVVKGKVSSDINTTTNGLRLLYKTTVTLGGATSINGDIYSERYGKSSKEIYRNGRKIYDKESVKITDVFRGGKAGNLALFADGNKVLAFDGDNLAMSVEIPHDIMITNITGDSMGNIFIGSTDGIYILGDTLQIKGYQLVG